MRKSLITQLDFEEVQPRYKCIETLYGHSDRVLSVLFSNDGRKILSSSRDKTIKLWDLKGNLIRTFSGHTHHVLKAIFHPTLPLIASASLDQTIRIWNLGKENSEPLSIVGHTDGVGDIKFHPDGDTLASASADHTIRFWSLDGQELFQFNNHTNRVLSIDYSHDGKYIISGSSDQSVRIWNLETRKSQKLIGHKGEVWCVKCSPDGNTFASAASDATIIVWNFKGEIIKFLVGHQSTIFDIEYNSTGNKIISTSVDTDLRIWDLELNQVQKLTDHESWVNAAIFSPNNQFIVSASRDNTIKLWQQKNITYVPQGINNDLAQGDDQLSIEDELQAITDVLLLRQLQPPIAVGILGTWGSGKSFGMHLIQKRVNEIRCANRQLIEAWGEGLDEDDPDKEKKLSPYVGHIYQIKFNAWSYAKQNLWASLMQEIFAELNQQITFERQLQEAGVDLLSGSKLWEALEKLNETDQQIFLDDLSEQQKEKLAEIQDELQIENALLETINQSKQEQIKDFTVKQKKLQNCKLELERRKQLIIEETDTKESLILGAVSNIAKQRLGKPLLEKLETKLKQELSKQDLDETQLPDFKALLDKAMTKTMEENTQNISFSLLKQWAKKNWIYLTLLGLLVIASLLIPYIIAHWKTKPDLITQITGILVPFLPTIAASNQLLKNFSKWHEETMLALSESQAHLETQIERKIASDPELQQQKQDIETLEQELAQESKYLPKSNYVTLADFLGDRLKPENYSDRLGMLNQVQQDLQDLSDKLLPLKEEQDEETKKLFPRGEPRVILYIDDLDRCPPNRVVEVLETVQLILKTQLFVVVLAVDDRYVARALEEVYSGVLKRRGKPSGIDYLEKIIQIPYRMRPISADTIGQYLSSQIYVVNTQSTESEPITLGRKASTPAQEPQLTQAISDDEPIPLRQQEGNGNDVASPLMQQENEEAIAQQIPQQISQQDISQQTIELEPIEPEPDTSDLGTNINEINTIEQVELDLIVQCCRYVDITPRTGKRLINIYKILKIIWRKRQEPTQDTKQVIFSFLALSARYPDFMRNLFEEIDTELQEKIDIEENQFDYKELMNAITPQVPELDPHAQREWRKFKADIRQMLPCNPFTLSRDDFELALSFCFVGDIGYDPDDFSGDRLLPNQQ